MLRICLIFSIRLSLSVSLPYLLCDLSLAVMPQVCCLLSYSNWDKLGFAVAYFIDASASGDLPYDGS